MEEKGQRACGQALNRGVETGPSSCAPRGSEEAASEAAMGENKNRLSEIQTLQGIQIDKEVISHYLKMT